MSGIRNINKIINKHKEDFGNKFEVYFHQDLDGVCSALAIINYLNKYGMILVDCHIIQYGSLEYAVRSPRPGSMAVLVDFANFKSMFTIATDHHDKQRGTISGTSHTKTSRSNAETISREISSDIFTYVDVEMIQTIDSANFYKYKLTPRHIQNTKFVLRRKSSPGNNRFKLGLACNKLLLSYKNKRITLGKYHNKNLLECLVLDSSPSIYSIYNNLQRYVNGATSLEWNKTYFSHNVPVPMPTQEDLYNNITEYKKTREKTKDITIDTDLMAIIQNGIGDVFKTGAYDRYIPFENNPECNFLITLLPMGFLQASCNPFKERSHNSVNLADVTKELLHTHKLALSNINISLVDIKRVYEVDIKKMKSKFGTDYSAVGFNFEDLQNYYPNSIISLPNRSLGDFKTRETINLTTDTSLRKTMNKPFSTWSESEIEYMEWFRIPIFDIILQNSGGHKSITNIQGLNFLECRTDLLKYYYKTTNPLVVMEILLNDFIAIMRDMYLNENYIIQSDLYLGAVDIVE